MTIVLRQKARRLDHDLETIIGLYLNRLDRGSGVLLESAEVDGRWGRHSLAAGGFLLAARCVGGRLDLEIKDSRLAPLRDWAGLDYLEGLRGLMKSLRLEPDQDFPRLPAMTRALYGFLGYGAAALMEKKLRPLLPPAEAEAAFILPARLFFFDHAYNQLTEVSLAEEGGPDDETGGPAPGRPPAASSAGDLSQERSGFSREAFLAAALRIKELIRRGEVIQVVLSNRFSAPFTGDLFDVYRRLRRINPSPHMFFQRLPEIALAVSSPEVLVSCDAGRLRLCPIAGTRPRGRGQAEDEALAAELLADPKEQAEHVMLVDLGRSDLGRVAAPGTVRVDSYMRVEHFSHVMHLTSRLSADLAAGRDAVDILSAVFPAGTLSGAPKVRAMEIIAAGEPTSRGPYGGALGWLGLDQEAVSLDLGIAIRGLWAREGQVFWQAGAGLVYDSDPESEWRECLAKAEAPRQALRP